MKSISNETKSLFLIGCLTIVCVVLIAVIYSRFQIEPAKDSVMSPHDTMSNEITQAANTNAMKPDDKTSEKKDDFVVKPIESSTPQNSDEIIQSNELEPVKPNPPEKPKPQGDVTNPSKPPEYKKEDTIVSKPADLNGGEKKDGKIYVPGFGWIEDNGGGGEGTVVDGEGDINKQVGNMD